MIKYKKDALQIKIGSLGDEARRIRAKELSLLAKAQIDLLTSAAKNRGIDPNGAPPPDLDAEVERRTEPMCGRMARDGNIDGVQGAFARVAHKAIRKYMLAGMTKEEILALPGMKYAIRERARATDLRRHRKVQVRHESRHSQLAYAFLRGKPYKHAEDKANSYPNWDKIQEIATRFSYEDKRDIAQRFEQWRQEAYNILRGRDIALPYLFFQSEPYRVI